MSVARVFEGGNGVSVGSRTSVVNIDGLIVRLVHVDDPKHSSFSHKKKQCDLWEFVWGSSVLLSGLLSSVDLKGCSVLEIGGGSGLCSLVASLRGGKVTMSDVVEDAVRMCELSAIENGCRKNMLFEVLDWSVRCTFDVFDILIGSDVLFMNRIVKDVARVVCNSLKPGGVALIADPCRLNVDDFVSFVDSEGCSSEVYLWKDSKLSRPRSLALEDESFVVLKRAKLVIVRKPGSNDAVQSLIDSQLREIVDQNADELSS